jgi:hypothetical protein
MYAIGICRILPKQVASRRRNDFALGAIGNSWAVLGRHAEHDDAIIEVLRRSCHLPFDEKFHVVSAQSLSDLAAYPFIYAASIASLSKAELSNLAEYLRRGGFILIDACRNNDVNPSIPRFLAAQVAQFRSVLPDLEIGKLKPEHRVFSIYYKMHHFPPFRKTDGPEPLYAVITGGRTVGIVSLSGFQCAWSGYADGEENAAESLQMAANIYIYAMNH